MLDTIFLQIFDMTKVASLVILAVLLVRLCLKRAPKVFSYALWAVVLFRLLCPVSIEAPVSLIPQTEPTVESYDLLNEPITPVAAMDAAQRAVGDVLNGGIGIQHVRTTDVDADGTARVISTDFANVWMLFGKYVWVAGIAVMLVYSGISCIKLRRKLLASIKVRDNIYIADDIDTPFVMGLFRPKIYLPSSLSEKERGYIILHEQHHIRRGDHIIKLLSFAALCLHWFNPLVWVAFILSGKDMEMNCDEAVLRKLGEDIRVDYSASLISLATGRRIIAGTPLAFGEGNTEGRIKNIAKWKKPAVWVIVIAVIVCVAVVVCLITNPMRTEDTHPDTQENIENIQDSAEDISAVQELWNTIAGENLVLPSNSAPVISSQSGKTIVSFQHDGKFAEITENNLYALIADSIFLYFQYDRIEMPEIISLFSEYPQTTLTWEYSGRTLSIVDTETAEKYYFLYEGRTIEPLHAVDDDEKNLELFGADDLNGDGTITEAEKAESGILHRQTAYFTVGQDIRNLILYRLIALSEPDAFVCTADGDIIYMPLGTVFTDDGTTITDKSGNILYPTAALELRRMVLTPTTANVSGAFDSYLYIPIDGANYRYERIYDDPTSVTKDELIYTFTEKADPENVDWHIWSVEGFPNRSVVLAEAGDDYVFLYQYSPSKAVDHDALTAAKAAGMITLEDGYVTSGEELWDTFYDKTQAGKSASVMVAHYYTLENGNYDGKYYEVYKEDYPSMYTFDLTYDESTYTMKWNESGTEYVRTYKYLRKFEDTLPTPQSAKEPQAVTRYVLTNDNTATLDELWRSVASSQLGDYIDFYTIYSDKK